MNPYINVTKLKGWPELEAKGFQRIKFKGQWGSFCYGAALMMKGHDLITVEPFQGIESNWYNVQFHRIKDEERKLIEYKDQETKKPIYLPEPVNFYGIKPRELVKFILTHKFTKILTQ